MEKEQLLEIVGYVKVSDYRTNTLKFIGNSRKMPSEIAKHLGVGTSHASNILRALKKYDLVVCSNPNARKGRLYANTPLAHEVLENLD